MSIFNYRKYFTPFFLTFQPLTHPKVNFNVILFFFIAKYYYQDKKTHLERKQNHYAYTSLIHSCVSLQKFQGGSAAT